MKAQAARFREDRFEGAFDPLLTKLVRGSYPRRDIIQTISSL
jgi:hypothetical protein